MGGTGWLRFLVPAWLSMLLLIAPEQVLNAGEPPLEEIRRAFREHLPGGPNEELLRGLNRENLDAVLRELDPHARFFPAGQGLDSDLEVKAGAGIGAELFFRDESTHLSAYPGGPLALAGFVDRVVLLAVDDVPVHGLAAGDTAKLLRGASGSRVRLTVAPVSNGQTSQAALLREVFHPLAVAPIQIDDIVVLQLRRFEAGKTCAALRASIEFLGSRQNPLFLDLRESTGGDVYEAMDCAALFVPEGQVLGGLRRSGSSGVMFRSPGGKKYALSVVILIGPDTASAAETFAGALQHHDRAVLVGRQTYGKCSTQTERHLSDGSLLRLTNGVVLRPDGTTCQGEGLLPDVSIHDDQLFDTEAMIRHALEGKLPKQTIPLSDDREMLRRLHTENRLTVRALRAWDRLPSKYMRLMLDMLALDQDLLGADALQVRTWAEEATTDETSSMAPFAAELNELAAFMMEGGWDRPDF
ncbi:S41 family peptidase [Desulfonatronum lacustre]|uniref:S41 family peptidase n=1 Tax=Desulfonatronum lacustre TaxID=66849 RepID=UPI0004B813E2|nr:S41 family peptidase [Desulfonatronum lacustre]